MQAEIGLGVPAGAAIAIRILGINEAGQESGNAGMVVGRTLPFLQDTPAEYVWGGRWQVEWRDVVVLDAQNRRIAVYNLTAHDLGLPANYAELRDLLLAAASSGSAAKATPAEPGPSDQSPPARR